MRLAAKSLQDLTNKFLKEFCDLAYSEQVKEKVESKMPNLVNAERSDSFQFNYALAECIAYSEMGVKSCDSGGYALMDSGFVQNTIKTFFQNSIQGICQDMVFIIDNHKNKDDIDYGITSLKDSIVTKDEEKSNIDHYFDKTQPKTVVETNTYRTVTFKLHNSKSGYTGVVHVNFINNELDKIFLFDSKGKNNSLEIRRRLNSYGTVSQIQEFVDEPTIHGFDNVKDINSFFITLSQVKYGIKEVIEGK